MKLYYDFEHDEYITEKELYHDNNGGINMIYNCIADRHNVSTIILFGLFIPVYAYSASRKTNIGKSGLSKCCSTRDQYGNVYSVYSNYDPTAPQARTVALLVEEEET